jgi:hypothetical protein
LPKKNAPQSRVEGGTEGGRRIELEGRHAFANVSKLGMRLDIVFDTNPKRPEGVDTSSARQDRDGVAKDSISRGKSTTHGPGFAGLELK